MYISENFKEFPYVGKQKQTMIVLLNGISYWPFPGRALIKKRFEAPHLLVSDFRMKTAETSLKRGKHFPNISRFTNARMAHEMHLQFLQCGFDPINMSGLAPHDPFRSRTRTRVNTRQLFFCKRDVYEIAFDCFEWQSSSPHHPRADDRRFGD
jgi:hypothetical protein